MNIISRTIILSFFTWVAIANAQYHANIDSSLMLGNKRNISRTGLVLPLYQQNNNLLFITGVGMMDSKDALEGNFGLGFRKLHGNSIYGIYNYFDLRRSELQNLYQQLTFGFEFLKENFEFRGNVYVPLSKKKLIDGSQFANIKLSRTNSLISTKKKYEVPSYGYDLEAGIKIFSRFEVFGAYYHFGNPITHSLDGVRFRGNIKLHSNLSIKSEYSFDNVRKHSYFAGLGLNIQIGHTKNNLSTLQQKMTSLPVRDIDIVTINGEELREVSLHTSSNGQSYYELFSEGIQSVLDINDHVLIESDNHIKLSALNDGNILIILPNKRLEFRTAVDIHLEDNFRAQLIGNAHLIMRSDKNATGVGTIRYKTGAHIHIQNDDPRNPARLELLYNPNHEEIANKYQNPLDILSLVSVNDGGYAVNDYRIRYDHNPVAIVSPYMMVNDAVDVRLMFNNFGSSENPVFYAITRDIDFQNTDIEPFQRCIIGPEEDEIQLVESHFHGEINGLGNTISNLNIIGNDATYYSVRDQFEDDECKISLFENFNGYMHDISFKDISMTGRGNIAFFHDVKNSIFKNISLQFQLEALEEDNTRFAGFSIYAHNIIGSNIDINGAYRLPISHYLEYEEISFGGFTHTLSGKNKLTNISIESLLRRDLAANSRYASFSNYLHGENDISNISINTKVFFRDGWYGHSKYSMDNYYETSAFSGFGGEINCNNSRFKNINSKLIINSNIIVDSNNSRGLPLITGLGYHFNGNNNSMNMVQTSLEINVGLPADEGTRPNISPGFGAVRGNENIFQNMILTTNTSDNFHMNNYLGVAGVVIGNNNQFKNIIQEETIQGFANHKFTIAARIQGNNNVFKNFFINQRGEGVYRVSKLIHRARLEGLNNDIDMPVIFKTIKAVHEVDKVYSRAIVTSIEEREEKANLQRHLENVSPGVFLVWPSPSTFSLKSLAARQAVIALRAIGFFRYFMQTQIYPLNSVPKELLVDMGYNNFIATNPQLHSISPSIGSNIIEFVLNKNTLERTLGRKLTRVDYLNFVFNESTLTAPVKGTL